MKRTAFERTIASDASFMFHLTFCEIHYAKWNAGDLWYIYSFVFKIPVAGKHGTILSLLNFNFYNNFHEKNAD